MTHVIGFAGLLALLIGWFGLALIPTLLEVLAPKDAGPLPMVGHDDETVAEVAAILRSRLDEAIDDTASNGFLGRMDDGTALIRLSRRDRLPEAMVGSDGVVRHVVIADARLALEGGETFLNEVYARAGLVGGADIAFRALLADEPVELGERTSILRWLYCESDVVVGPSSRLLGRILARGVITIGAGTTFTRLEAPTVIIGSRPDCDPQDPPITERRHRRAPRRLGAGLRLQRGERLDGPCIINGDLVMAEDADVRGDIKAHGEIRLGCGARVAGSLIARGAIDVGDHGIVSGPVVSETGITVRGDSCVGSPGVPTSLVAPEITLFAPVTIHGLLVAGRTGRVTPTPVTAPADR